MIRRDKHRNVVTPVVSLDQEFVQTDLTYGDVVGVTDEADLASDTQEVQDEKYAPLYQALDCLTERQQHVVKKHFGLDGAPETFDEIGHEVAINPDAAWKHWKAAQKRLKKLLAEQYR